MMPHALIVYDDSIFGREVEDILRKTKCRVDRVKSGSDAVSLLMKFEYEILVTKLLLNDHIDGDYLSKMVRRRKAGQPSLTVGISSFISGYGRNKNFDLIFSEPFISDELVTIMRENAAGLTSAGVRPSMPMWARRWL